MLSPDVDLRYRVAVHYGNVMILPDDVLGIAVNAAMHMQGLAPPGGICISGDLFEQLQEPRRAHYAYAGRRYIKKIPDPLDIYFCRSDLRTSGQARSGRPPVLRHGVLSPLPRLGIADLRVHAEAATARRRRLRAGCAASSAKLGQMPKARSHAEQVRRRQPNFSAGEWRDVVPWQREPAAEYAEFLARRAFENTNRHA